MPVTYYVQSPEDPARVYPVSAVERSNLTARGYIDVTRAHTTRAKQVPARPRPAAPTPPGPPAQNSTEEVRD